MTRRLSLFPSQNSIRNPSLFSCVYLWIMAGWKFPRQRPPMKYWNAVASPQAWTINKRFSTHQPENMTGYRADRVSPTFKLVVSLLEKWHSILLFSKKKNQKNNGSKSTAIITKEGATFKTLVENSCNSAGKPFSYVERPTSFRIRSTMYV